MKGHVPLFLGIFGTFAFSWAGLTLIPNAQIGHLEPQADEDGNDPYPAPKSGLADRGRHVYVANGCVYCHSQQVRADYAASDIERKWGERRSAPRDYIYERPALLGRMRMGPDLANIGKRAPADDAIAPAPDTTKSANAAPAAAGAAPATSAPAPGAAKGSAAPPPTGAPLAQASAANPPASAASSPAVPAGALGASPAPVVAAQNADPAVPPSSAGVGSNTEPALYSAAWHHRHLYAPRTVTWHSTMPAFRFLYETRRITGQHSADALQLGGPDAAPDGWEIVPTPDAKALVAYLMSLDQSHALKEVKSTAPLAAAVPGKAVK